MARPGFSPDDHTFMDHALRLGRRGLGLTWPNPSVGCVLVRNGAIVGRGLTQPGGRPHGETTAIAHAGAAARGSTAYVTLEPCSHYGRTAPCSDALARAGIVRVVCAIGDPDPRVRGRGFTMLRAYGIGVDVGLGEEEAGLDHRGHFTRVRLGRPFVQLKMALSADGFVAASGGARTAITGPRANDRVHLMRAMADAIMVGIGTVLADDPMLTCRLPGMEHRSPVRVVVDSRLRLPLASRLVATARDVPTWVLGTVGAPPDAERALRAAGCEVMLVRRLDDGTLDLGAALRLIGVRGITRVLAEGGPRLAAGLIGSGLADEIVLARSPDPLGTGVPAFSAPLPDRYRLAATEPAGRDIIETYRQET
ncbi:bifunctional diaminohydroxyphosphoribosylaminopyrimidine deaminase/5-amino-6-(5-phosphoribosylamino)uracil reductase RibD [Phreatobacter sp.]|uniref:bifunctional diaminohydroxyphosphoribosylaminopyrimidine deaminase/5-amino-6-(5-phosphoribosylamino)uracil reductase RibD n=1 Tax=Phreatobacter sp. TaxID=1966341 RepID=UPI003F70C574